ncbi:MAG: response regulator [bacterium]|nr:response regulator [bacterium]
MNRTLLLCDDDRLLALWLTRLVKPWGWQAIATHSVGEAMAALKGAKPDVLIIDLFIANETAADLIKRMSALPQLANVPSILTTSASDSEIDQVLGSHDMPILRKPVDPTRLKTLLDALQPTVAAVDPGSLSILMIDDGGIQSKVLGRTVEESGAFVIYAPDIESAKSLIRNVRPDGVLLQCDGSARDALELSAFCSTNRMQLPPMAAVCSVINQTLVEQLLRVGVIDILLKPISTARLHDTVRRMGGALSAQPVFAQDRRTIMVVEDFTITAKMLERLLLQAGYVVHVVRTGEMAFEMIRRVRPSMLLLDLNLPGISGADLLQGLNASGQAVPSIVITGERDPQKLRAARKLGTLRIFQKPLPAEDLIAYIGGYFSDPHAVMRSRAEYDVLLALADEATALVVAGALESAGLSCKVVSDGYQALHEISREPQLVVLDIVISGLDGTEIMRRANNVLLKGRVRLLAIAEELDDEIIAELRTLGAHDTLSKPYGIGTVTEKIRALIAGSAPAISVRELADEIIPELRRAGALPDQELYQTAARLAHNLRSTGDLAGLPALSKLAAALGDAARTQYRKTCEDILSEMRVEIDRALMMTPP